LHAVTNDHHIANAAARMTEDRCTRPICGALPIIFDIIVNLDGGDISIFMPARNEINISVLIDIAHAIIDGDGYVREPRIGRPYNRRRYKSYRQ